MFKPLLIVLLAVGACSRVEPDQDRPSCDGTPFGSIKTEQCPAGQDGKRVSMCTENGFVVLTDECKQDNSCGGVFQGKTLFVQNLKPVIDAKCMACHNPSQYNDYGKARKKINEFIDVINRSPSDPKKMPKYGYPDLNEAERKLFQKWKDDGLLEGAGCPETDHLGGVRKHLDLDYVESAVLADLTRLADAERGNARYIVLSHKYNEGASAYDMNMFIGAINKAINMVSSARFITALTPVDEKRTVFRLDVKAYGLSAQDWENIVAADTLKLVAETGKETRKGKLIKDLAGTQVPWLHGDNFILVTHGNPNIYNQLMRTANDITAFFQQINVDFQKAVTDFKALFVGFNGSRIAGAKNRLLVRVDNPVTSIGGYMWCTYDVDDRGLADQNLFNFPLLKETGGKAIYNFQASECFWTLKNGLHGGALFNAAGQRQNDAPTNVVINTESRFSSTIVVHLDCARCHPNGILSAKDQVLAALNGSSQIDSEDFAKATALYRGTEGLLIAEDQKIFNAALLSLGVDPVGPDPMNYLTDFLRSEHDLKRVAALVFMTEDEFKSQLAISAATSAKLKPLLNGGVVTFQTLVLALPDLKREFRFGQERLGQ